MRAQRPVLAKRYAIHLPLDLGDVTPRFVGTDVATGQTVVVVFAGPEQTNLSGPGIGALQRHLAGMVDSVASPNLEAFPSSGERPPDGTAFVAELIRGRALAELVRREPLNQDRAVAWTIRILEGLQVLHQRQVPHGALSSHAVVAEPKGRPIAPVVSQLLVPPLRDYASPERLTGTGPTVADDLWAVGLLLFEMLTGKLPFHAQASTWGRCELNEADSQRLRALPQGRELEGLVKRALSFERGRRPGSAEEFIAWLDRWEQRSAPPAVEVCSAVHVPAASKAGQPASWDRLVVDFEGGGARLDATLDAAEQMRHSILAERMPSLSASSLSERPGPGVARRRTPSIGPELAAFRERSKPKFGKALLLLGLLSMFGASGFYFLGDRDGREKAALAASVRPSSEPVLVASSNAVERPRRSATEERSQCIRSYYRPETIAERIDLGFVCTEEDFLAVNRRLNEDVMMAQSGVAGVAAAGAPSEVPTNPAMVIRSGVTAKGWQLGWYELVATAIIRQNCCREAAPIKLPESTGWCQQLQAVVRRIAADSVKVGDISPGVRVFDEAITCLMAQGRHTVYPYKAVPTSLQKLAFQQFLKHAAEVDARRTSRR